MAAGDRAFWSDIQDAIRPPSVRLVQQAAQSFASSTNLPLTFAAGSEEYDTHNLHDVAVNNSRVTIGKTGRYQCYVCVNWASATTISIATAFIGKNGVAVQPFKRSKPNTATATTLAWDALATVECNAGDYIEGFGAQVSGGAILSQASGGVNSVLEVRYVGAI